MVWQAGEADPDLFFTDRPRDTRLGQRNKEYVSLFADDAPRVLSGRSPMECYTDFMRAFRDTFLGDLGGAVEEVVIGMGPCGELRYPSYVEANGWRFPGVCASTRSFSCGGDGSITMKDRVACKPVNDSSMAMK